MVQEPMILKQEAVAAKCKFNQGDHPETMVLSKEKQCKGVSSQPFPFSSAFHQACHQQLLCGQNVGFKQLAFRLS